MSEAGVILITGASSGIGEATAWKFAREGYCVMLAARRYDRLVKLADQIIADGGQAMPIEADLSKLGDCQGMARTAVDSFGKIDVLFNNAGFGRLDWLENLDPVKDIEAQIQVNLLGVIQTTRAILPGMIERRKGHIITMGSVGGFVATPTYTIYAASKFAVRGFSEALRREVGVHNIHVSLICPGGVATEFKSHTGANRKTGVTTPKRLRLSAEQVAEIVWQVVQKPKSMVVVPWVFRLAAGLNALAPGLVDWIIQKRFVEIERDLRQ